MQLFEHRPKPENNFILPLPRHNSYWLLYKLVRDPKLKFICNATITRVKIILCHVHIYYLTLLLNRHLALSRARPSQQKVHATYSDIGISCACTRHWCFLIISNCVIRWDSFLIESQRTFWRFLVFVGNIGGGVGVSSKPTSVKKDFGAAAAAAVTTAVAVAFFCQRQRARSSSLLFAALAYVFRRCFLGFYPKIRSVTS